MRRLSCLLAGIALLLAGPPRHGGAGENEAGFAPLFNGKNLDGWKTKKGNEPLDGKTEAYGGRFKVEGGLLVIDPKVKGDVIIETARQFKDVQIKFEFNPGPGCNNDLFLHGIKFDIVAKQLKNVKEGEWNTLEIIATGTKLEHKVNGESKRVSTTKVASSVFGIRAEFGPLQIRNLRVKE